MGDTEPMPNRKWEMIIASIVFLVVGTVFTAWRLIVRLKVSNWWSMSDWLMLFGVVSHLQHPGLLMCLALILTLRS
jgi:hypothetical protein